MRTEECILVIEFIFVFLTWWWFMGMRPLAKTHTTEWNHHVFLVNDKRNYGTKKLLLPETLAQQSQQYSHKAKSGRFMFYRGNTRSSVVDFRQTNKIYIILQGTNSNALVLWVRNPDSCSYSGSVLHLTDDISRCSSSRDSLSKDDEAPV